MDVARKMMTRLSMLSLLLCTVLEKTTQLRIMLGETTFYKKQLDNSNKIMIICAMTITKKMIDKI